MPSALVRSQIKLILQELKGAGAHPANWDEDDNDVDYLYRRNNMLCRPADVDRVVRELRDLLEPRGEQSAEQEQQRPETVIRVHGVIDGVVRIEYSSGKDTPTVPQLLDELDRRVGPGVARPDHILHICPHACPATEPEEVGVAEPFPAVADDQKCSGENVFVSIVDTGLIAEATAQHSWLAGVNGTIETTFDPSTGRILPYAGHGTFGAGTLRCVAPKASVFVESANLGAGGAQYETEVVQRLTETLSKSPDIIVLTLATDTRGSLPLMTFDALYESTIRHIKGLVMLCPADNEGTNALRWPAAYPWVVSVGALSANWQQRATFSNYGGWVDVYAPGEGLVNAFATGEYECFYPPNEGVLRQFKGIAKWSGTSYSTPLVAGLIAARMSVTGENGQQAAESLLQFARSQAIPGVGAILLPGQACFDVEGC
ncbi:S8/S53 family peptidase [Kibdelosporangium philippinense]|uniref:S8/S53 family peptidase n=1 Tax=Kibdelosporangium philippinense TaxID=211113 RepID=A0ABS8Z4F2_9PSEU|nr:S8/S53 family peptidase [Kibdelosporangium philippinense]MCE7002357.1 S8/S53 family peptidase [Kibdelosporangium philippinense]